MSQIVDADDYVPCCGCCGLPLDDKLDGDTEAIWCVACQEHVLSDGPPWEVTYFAQHAKPCPFSEDFAGVLARIDAVLGRGQ